MDIYRNLVDGKWLPGTRQIDNINPSDTTDIVGRYEEADAGIAAQAVQAAYRAFPSWSDSPLASRCKYLAEIAAQITARSDQLARTIAREEGKTLNDARGEANRAADVFRFYAGEVLRLGGELLTSLRPGVHIEVTREPIGVAALITPWNFPIAIPAWKTAAALAYGNCVVLKPSELAPAGAWILADIIASVGLPPGVFNIIMGNGAKLGHVLLSAPEVAAVSFTGSVPTGRHIAAQAIAGNKKLQMEMGGKNPLIVLDDADLEIAVDCAVDGAFHATGQRCTASSRLIVTDGIYNRFVQTLWAKVASLRVGHALEPDTQIGPVASEAQLHKNLEYIELARREGGHVQGGKRLERATTGYFLEPCLITGLDNHSRVCQEEIFGPVSCVIRAKDYDEALEIANQTPFGLSSGICTTSLKYATHFKRYTQSGLAMVNMPTSGVDYHAPFGGRKGSSYGPREQGRYASEFFTSVKTSYIRP